MNPPDMIASGARLAEFLAARGGGEIALDTEFMRERTYAPQLCVVQICTGMGAGARAACIDALALEDLSPLFALLADDSAQKIFHSCRQDLEALDTRGDLRARNVYDTQIAAAFCGYGEQVSYAALVESLCDVHLPKAHTRADWSRRPLSPQQLQYALDDVAYLPALRDALDTLLAQNGRAEWHREECMRAAEPSSYRVQPGDAWLRLKGVEKLSAAARACAQPLAAWRERRARARNLPRGWVLPNPALLQICRSRPRTMRQLAEIEGVSRGLCRVAGEEILAMTARARNAQPDDNPPPLDRAQQRRMREIMQLLDARARDAGMSRALLAVRRDIENFVRGKTDAPLFAGWRAQFAGEEILARYS